MNPEGPVTVWDFERLYVRTLKRLSPVRRDVWVRRNHDGQTFKKIARDLGIVEATARAHSHFALVALQHALHRYQEEG